MIENQLYIKKYSKKELMKKYFFIQLTKLANLTKNNKKISYSIDIDYKISKIQSDYIEKGLKKEENINNKPFLDDFRKKISRKQTLKPIIKKQDEHYRKKTNKHQVSFENETGSANKKKEVKECLVQTIGLEDGFTCDNFDAILMIDKKKLKEMSAQASLKVNKLY